MFCTDLQCIIGCVMSRLVDRKVKVKLCDFACYHREQQIKKTPLSKNCDQIVRNGRVRSRRSVFVNRSGCYAMALEYQIAQRCAADRDEQSEHGA